MKKKGKLRENIEAILIAVVIALFIRTFIVQAFKIPSGSMKDTLLVGDHILVNKFIYGVKIPFTDHTLIPIKEPERGDIIVFKFPEDPSIDFIKRVIGIEGDVVEIKDKEVYINNEPMDPWPAVFKHPRVISGKLDPRDNFGPVTVPPDSLFMLGDNRDNSRDSRYWGFVDIKAVRGKALIIYWSWDKHGVWSITDNNFKVRWDRLANLLK